MKLGIFDSGIGGEAIAQSLKKVFPDADIIVVNDREHLPYGDRKQAEIISLTDKAIQPLLSQDCDVIILACNSATAAAIETLRERYSKQKFIGLEPMVKPAATITRTHVITVCATPATLASERYRRLKETYAQNIEVYEPDCSRWARMIEDNTINEQLIAGMVHQSKDRGSDVIVLACTHYHWIKHLITELAGDQIRVLDPSEAIAKRLNQLIG